MEKENIGDGSADVTNYIPGTAINYPGKVILARAVPVEARSKRRPKELSRRYRIVKWLIKRWLPGYYLAMRRKGKEE